MEKKRLDDHEPGPIPSPRAVDRFGFVKQDANTSSDGLVKSRSANEYERYFVPTSYFLRMNKIPSDHNVLTFTVVFLHQS